MFLCWQQNIDALSSNGPVWSSLMNIQPMKRFWLHPSFIQCWSLLFQVLRSVRNIWIHSPIWDPKLLKWANWCIYFSKDLVGFYVQSKCFLPYPLQICGMSVSMRGYLSNVIKHFSQTWQMLSDQSLKNSRNGREDSWNSHFKRLPSLAHGVFRFPWKRPCFFVRRDSKRELQFHQRFGWWFNSYQEPPAPEITSWR